VRINELDADFPESVEGEHVADFPDEEFAVLLQHGPAHGIHFLVAEDAGRVVGFAATRPRNTAVEGLTDEASATLILSRIMVEADARRTAVGSQILTAMEARARARQVAIFQAHIPASAEDFYRANGWTVEAPGHALAWIESPSQALWDQGNRQGFTLGPRRAMTMLRTEDPSSDDRTGFDRLAFKILHPDRLVEHFTFAYGSGPSTMFDAMRVIALESNKDPARFAALPVDVSRTVFDMGIVPTLGLVRAEEIRRARR
jgi:GNAT superfamily N-acetyltransferase